MSFWIWSYYISNRLLTKDGEIGPIDDANHVSNAGDGIDPRNRA